MHRRRLPPRSSRSSALYQLGIDSDEEASSSGDEYAGTSSSDDDFEETTADNRGVARIFLGEGLKLGYGI